MLNDGVNLQVKRQPSRKRKHESAPAVADADNQNMISLDIHCGSCMFRSHTQCLSVELTKLASPTDAIITFSEISGLYSRLNAIHGKLERVRRARRRPR